jgi:alpha-glucosidase
LPETEVASPDGSVRFEISPNAERLTFGVFRDGVTIIEPSPLRMLLDGYDLSSGVVLKKSERYEMDETYPWRGARSTAVNRCNGVRISFQHDLSFIEYVFEVRAFNDGVAWRHIIPGSDEASRVPDEDSSFVIPAGATVWYAGLAGGHYEDNYARDDISAIEAGAWAGPPLTFKLPEAAGYASITEANLVNYSGMGLEADGRRGWTIGLGHRHPLNYPFELRYGREEGKRLGQPASIEGTITTPWRVIIIGPDLNTLVNSTILPNLCPPPDPDLFPDGIRTAWITPGRAVWRYLDGGPQGLEGMKEFSDIAARLGFEHHVVEGFWSRWSMEERRELVEYSRERHVGLWFWKHSRDLRTPQARAEFFDMLHELGVVGAKIDFFDHEARDVVDLYETLLRDAAGRRIQLVFHGANKPTGRERTWPNEAVREAVRGMESSRLMDRARHQTTLPFTRCLAGGADYTAMIFGERRRDTTWAHQIASMVVFSSPLLTVAANPHSILAHPAVEVIKSIPSTWDETIVLPDSEIGELAAYARRSGDVWYLAVLCGPGPRSVMAPLSFLGAGVYSALVVRDAPLDDAAVEIVRSTCRRDDILPIDLRAGGGIVVQFHKVE